MIDPTRASLVETLPSFPYGLNRCFVILRNNLEKALGCSVLREEEGWWIVFI